MYIPQIGFLLVISTDSLPRTSKSTSDTTAFYTTLSEFNGNDVFMETGDEMKTQNGTDQNSEHNLDQIRAEFEFINQLEFVFKSNGHFYYRTERTKELDQQFGDISSDINDLESEIMDGLQDEFLKWSHYYANMIDFCSEIDALLAFAMVAKENNYVRPKFGKDLNEENNSFIRIKVRNDLMCVFNKYYKK